MLLSYKLLLKYSVSITFSCLLASHVFGASVSSISLADLVDAALAKQTSTEQSIYSAVNGEQRDSAWLATNPLVSVGYLQSDRQQGTNEAELTLTLPIKSRQQQSLDRLLKSALIDNKKQHQTTLRLYLSGIVRELVWQQELVALRLAQTTEKINFLADLASNYQALYEFEQLSRLSLLLIEQEQLAAQMEQLELQELQTGVINRLRKFTGLTNFPEKIVEPAWHSQQFKVSQHPNIVQLDSQWQQQLVRLQKNKNQSAGWNLSISAKNLSSEQITETQLGVSAELPVTWFDVQNVANVNEWTVLRNQYEQSRTELVLNVQQRVEQLLSQLTYLQKKQQMLEQSRTISKSIIGETSALIERSQINQEQAIKHMLSAFVTKAQYSQNQLLISQTNARLRQAAGISL